MAAPYCQAASCEADPAQFGPAAFGPAAPQRGASTQAAPAARQAMQQEAIPSKHVRMRHGLDAAPADPDMPAQLLAASRRPPEWPESGAEHQRISKPTSREAEA